MEVFIVTGICLFAFWKMELLNAVSVGIVGLLSFWFVKWKSSKDNRIDKIPGPIGWPFLGNLPQLPKGNPHLELTNFSKDHGPVFKLKLASSNAVVVNDYASIHEVLVLKGKYFAGRPFTRRRLYGFGGHLGISGSDPTEEWKMGRKVFHSSLKAFGTGMQRIEQHAIEMSREFIEAFKQTKEQPVDPEPIIYSATIRMISLMIFGRKFEENSESYMHVKEAIEEYLKGLSNNLSGRLLETFPWVRHFGNASFKHIRKGLENVSVIWQKKVLDRMSSWESENNQQKGSLPIAQALFVYEKDNTKSHAHIHDLFKKASCLQTAIAGTATTTNSMLSLLITLVHHPEVQTKIQEEIDAVLGLETIGLDHQANLPFTKATLYELHRYASVAPFSLPHKSMKDTTIGDHMVPKNTTILANLWALHHGEELWTEPFQFRPERFLDSDGQLVPADHPNRKHLLAFGAGPRVCPGETFAQARIFLWTVSIMQWFTLKAEGVIPDTSCDPRTYCPEQVLKPQPYQIRFIPREFQ